MKVFKEFPALLGYKVIQHLTKSVKGTFMPHKQIQILQEQ